MTTLKIVARPIAEVIPYELNSKKHPPEQVAKIVQSIQRFGWDQPIVVDRHGVIIKGHGRRLAAIELGMATVPVLVRADLSEDQVKAARMADNRVGLSDIDPTLMRAELEALGDLTHLDGIFDAKELDFMPADLGEINTDAFVDDMGAVVAEQKDAIDTKMTEARSGRVSLAKAFGFKDIDATGQLVIANVMAKAEAATGKKEGEALIAFLGALA